MKTQVEKTEAIEKLKKLKNSLPEFSMFGDPNHEAIDAQIQVIEGDMNYEDIVEMWGEEYDEDDEPNHITHQALEAESWMDGDMDLADLVDED